MQTKYFYVGITIGLLATLGGNAAPLDSFSSIQGILFRILHKSFSGADMSTPGGPCQIRHLNTTKPYAINGSLVHSTQFEKIDILNNSAIVINDGKIQYVGPALTSGQLKDRYDVTEEQIIQLTDKQFLMPGMIDSHIHAPQYPNAGLGYDKTLLDWLQIYTFPLEKKYNDETFARQVYRNAVRHSLDSGTTTASYFATIHLNSSIILADIMTELGQRGFVGKVNMNDDTVEGYFETTNQSVADTETFVENILNRNNDLVKPVITPRFALSCDMDLMTKLGALAKKYNVNIQTHISENTGEIEATLDLFKNSSSYAEVYDQANLLTPKTVLAHGVWLTDGELKLLAARGASVSHCPSSNTNLRSGLCNVPRIRAAGVKVGLGSDVSGGHAPSILDAMHKALDVSIHLSFQTPNSTVLDYQNVFYLATMGGAEALAVEDKVGNFIEGKDFDALIIDMTSGSLLNTETQTLIQKFVYTGDDRNIVSVFVNGHRVK